MFTTILEKLFTKENRHEEVQASYSHIYDIDTYFDGEKDYFTMGAPLKYNVDYYTMATRAYNLFITNEFVRAPIKRLAEFAVGKGLQLHCEPDIEFLLKKYNISLSESFSSDVQSLWSLYSSDTNVSANKRERIDQLALKIMINSFVAGDILIIRRVVNAQNEYQLIDGRKVYSARTIADNGNKIVDGVEIDEKGMHVAYYIRKESGDEERIQARDDEGNLYAWLCYADDCRISATRGYSPLGAIMQKMSNIGKYTENEVLASTINSKICATIDHNENSLGTPILKNSLNSSRLKADKGPAVSFENKTLLQKAITQLRKLTGGIVLNMPQGQKLNVYDTKRPNLNYGNFLDANTKYIYASMGIPYEVVLMVFQNNFSASRASLKMFEVILENLRLNVVIYGWYQIVYEQFFEIEVLKGNINAPKFIELKLSSGYAQNAYLKCRFIGLPIPHIDPVKEVNAVVSKIKNGLTSFEMALEELGNRTDFKTLCERRAKEFALLKEKGLCFAGDYIPDYAENDKNSKGRNTDE